MTKSVLEKIRKRDYVVGIYGLGYVGLPLALRFVEEGFPVLGFDVDEEKVKKLEAGESYIEHIGSQKVKEATQKGLRATNDFKKTGTVDAIIICVPTPLNKHREPDISFITGTMESCLPHLRKGQLIALESTTYPGTTEEEIVSRVEEKGFKVGEDFFIVFSPEREDPGRVDFTTKTTPKVCGGHTKNCLEVGQALYESAIETVVPVSSTKAAEMTKLLENIHRAVNIGLVNEMKVVADRMGIDIYEVIRAAATKPFGFVPYYPGPGLGGHCIPIDPFYLTWKAREYGVHTRFIELAGEINHSMPDYVISKIIDGLNLRQKSVKGSRILVLGIAYKKNVDDMRESPSVHIMSKLEKLGASVAYSDPHVPKFPKMREYHFDLSSVPLDPKTVANYDCVLIATDHDRFDYGMIQKNAQLIVDARGRYREPMPNLIRA
jgi:UDP-N-acetyl-D-glucosamine dehydrogenase